MFCRKCGSTLLDGDRFCSYCGAQVIDRGGNDFDEAGEAEEVVYNRIDLKKAAKEAGAPEKSIAQSWEDINKSTANGVPIPHWNLQGFPDPDKPPRKLEEINVDWEKRQLLTFEDEKESQPEPEAPAEPKEQALSEGKPEASSDEVAAPEALKRDFLSSAKEVAAAEEKLKFVDIKPAEERTVEKAEEAKPQEPQKEAGEDDIFAVFDRQLKEDMEAEAERKRKEEEEALSRKNTVIFDRKPLEPAEDPKTGEAFETSATNPRNGEALQKIDKFYTFSQKNEEFQKLLDKEYEKLNRGPSPEKERVSRIEGILESQLDAAAEDLAKSMAESEQKAEEKAVETAVALAKIENEAEYEAERKAKLEATMELKAIAQAAELEKPETKVQEIPYGPERNSEGARVIAVERAGSIGPVANPEFELHEKEGAFAVEETLPEAEAASVDEAETVAEVQDLTMDQVQEPIEEPEAKPEIEVELTKPASQATGAISLEDLRKAEQETETREKPLKTREQVVEALPWQQMENPLEGYNDKKKGKSSGFIVILAVIAALVIMELVLVGIVYLAPGSEAAEYVLENFGGAVNWIAPESVN